MNNNRLETIAARIIENQAVACVDARDIYLALDESGFITKAEAESLFRIDRSVTQTCEAWDDLFVEALTAHLVWERRPTGQIRGADVTWLLNQIEQGGSTMGRNVGALLTSLMAEAEQIDERLLSLALLVEPVVPHHAPVEYRHAA